MQPERAGVRITDQHLSDARAALKRAGKYMSADERAAAEQLFAIARRMKGKNVRQVLAALNDEQLLRRLQKILSTVRSLNGPKR